MRYSLLTVADVYNCGRYGTDAYNSGEVCGASTTGSNGGLAFTGADVMVPLGGGLLLMVIAGMLLVRNLRRHRSSTSDAPRK